MNKLQIFEPALCCPTGVCGPGVDPELLRITSVINNLKNNGIILDRFNLMNDPQEFVDSKVINDLINEKGVDILPTVILNNEVVKTGSYPTNEEIAKYLGVTEDKLEAPKAFGFSMSGE